MKKKVIAIDLNEVLRARSVQFDRFYAEQFGDEGIKNPEQPYKFDFRNDYEWKDKVVEESTMIDDISDEISTLDYIPNEDGKAEVDSMIFKSEEVEKTADEVYKEFIYQDFVQEIFGFAPLMYKNADVDFGKFVKEYKDDYELMVVSKENVLTIPHTLFFLSKSNSRISRLYFPKTDEEIWESCDVLLTTDPDLIKTKPSEKKVIKLERPYNTETGEGDMKCIQLVDILNDEEIKNKFKEILE